MSFTALNHAPMAAPVSDGNSQLPNQIRDAFIDLPADILSLLGTLWNGKPQGLDKATAQKLITVLSEHVTSLKQQIHTPTSSSNRDELVVSRKRNLEDDDGLLQDGSQEKKARLAEHSSSSKASVGASWSGTTFDGVSFTIPQRKKFTLTVSSTASEGLSASVPGSKTPEFAIPWNEIQTVVCLPVPEKTQAQKSFLIFPKGVNGLQELSSPAYETMVWTVPDTKAKGAAEDEPTQAQAIKAALAQNASVLEPSPKDFASEIPPIGGKKDSKAYHIKAFKGSKDGFLFLLPTGIIWAFKKPLIFFSFPCIDSISYTSVLQRTFNLIISARATPEPEAAAAEYEFSMLDQTDFAGIDAYIKKNGLQDASLAEQRRAKVYNVNGKKGGGGGEAEDADDVDGSGSGGGGGELQKAEAEAAAAAAAEDSDDEEEDENFDPGSDGEDGASSSSGSEDGDGENAAAAASDGEDLVTKELGSEAEDVEITDAEEEEDDEDDEEEEL